MPDPDRVPVYPDLLRLDGRVVVVLPRRAGRRGRRPRRGDPRVCRALPLGAAEDLFGTVLAQETPLLTEERRRHTALVASFEA
ncbi:hypothetical protein [Pseudonocardia xishanensis]|uniref:Uncharacterized protein n=1 Tax=Pseudonocardia xishanensis TaxID=630995 RepID=A0ABP8RVK6_9PSEU